MDKTIMGIDQSYTSCGFYVMDTQKQIKNFGVIKTYAPESAFERSWTIASSLRETIIEHNVDLVVVEGLAFSRFGNATRDLAGLQFTIYHHVVKLAQKEIQIVSPTNLKKFATNNGKAKKPDMVNAMPEDVVDVLTNQGFTRSKGLYDLADAFWLACYGLEQIRRTHQTNS